MPQQWPRCSHGCGRLSLGSEFIWPLPRFHVPGSCGRSLKVAGGSCDEGIGQSVMARNMRPGPDWVPAVVIERLGPLTYLVETTEQKLWKRHVDLLQELCVRIPNSTETTEDSEDAEQPVISLPGNLWSSNSHHKWGYFCHCI